jgi:hypothetical protein
VDELGHIRRLLAYVVELEDEGIHQAAVGAPAMADHLEHELACLGPPTIPSGSCLSSMELTPLTHVLGAAGLAPGLPAAARDMETGEREHLAAAPARSGTPGSGWRRKGFSGSAPRPFDVVSPYACG